MRKLFVLLAACISIGAMGQKNKAPQAYANTITAADLKKHLLVIAGKEMEGRETATEGQRKAAAYIENHFKSLGLVPGYKGSFQMVYPVYTDSLVKASLEVNGRPYELDKEFGLNLSSVYPSTIMAGEVVFVGNGISDSTRDDYQGINARGKIVLVLQGPASQTQPARRGFGSPVQEAALKNGAAGILLVQSALPRKISGNKSFPSVNVFKKTIYPNTFSVSEAVAKEIIGQDINEIKDSLKSGTVAPRTYQADVLMEVQKTLIKDESSNVIGFLEGTDLKDQFLIITAHYDHLGKRGDSVIYYGADDDGSGTVSVLELAEAFTKAKQAGKGPRRSIIFMTVSGEEKGLWGSAYYGDHPAYPLDKTTADLNIDMIGRIDPKRKMGDSTNYVYVVGDDKLSTDLRPISEAANKKYTKLELDYKYNDPNDKEFIYYRSDHYNFAKKGVPIIFYFNGTHNDYHRPTDTPDKINYDLMSKRAKLVFYTAWEMANRNEMLKRDLKLQLPGRG